MVSSAGLSEELTVTVAVLCMPGRVSKQNFTQANKDGSSCDYPVHSASEASLSY